MQTTIDRSLQPELKGIEKINVPDAKKYTLDNGINVYSINAGFQDLIKVEFLFFNESFNIKLPLLNSATNRMLADGTSKYTAQQLADQIDYYGSFYETDENSDFSSIILFSLNKYLESTLPYISDIIHDPVFPASEIETYIRNNKQRLHVENEKVNSVARRKFNQVIFGNQHSYGYYVQPDDYDGIKQDSLKELHRKKYNPANCTIVISGMVKDDAIKILNKYFGQPSTSNGSTISKQSISFAPSSDKKHIVEKEGAVQSAIRIGKPFFNRTHADYPGVAVLNTLLGGYFGSRLMSNVREDKGYTYGIGSAIVSMKQEGYFFISTEVGSDVTAPAIDEIYKEIELLKTESVDIEELEMARNYMLGTFLKSIDGAFHLAERFKSVYLSNLDNSYYERYLQKVNTIQPDELQALAIKYFDTSDLFEVVVGRK